MIKAGEVTNAKKEMNFFLADANNPQNGLVGHVWLAAEIQVCPPAGNAFANYAGTILEKGLGFYAYRPTAGELAAGGNEICARVVVPGAININVISDVVAFDPQDSGALGVANLDATISSRARPADVPTPNAIAAQADATLTASHGGGTWQQGNTVVPPTAAAIAATIWQLARAGNQPVGSFGEFIDAKISSAGGGGGGGGATADDVVNTLMAYIMDANADANAQTFKQRLNIIASFCGGDGDGIDGPVGKVKNLSSSADTQKSVLEFTVSSGVRRFTKRDGNP